MVLAPQDYELPEAVIRDADAAMYHAKESGKGQVKVFDRKLHEKALHLLQQETDLRKAVHKNQFQNHYQPIVRLDTAALVGFEALIRWTHPDLGMVYPGAFIPTAEETGLIIPITRLTVERACRDLQEWQALVGQAFELTVNVNISSRHFLLPTLLDDLKEVLEACDLPPSGLKLEITETALMEDSEETVRLARRLKDFGIRIVIDDFGTGYSSLSYLQRLPIDTLKVDRSFVSKLHDDPGGQPQHRGGHHLARPQAGHDRRGRGHRNSRAVRHPARLEVRARSRLPLLPAHAQVRGGCTPDPRPEFRGGRARTSPSPLTSGLPN